MSKEEEYIKSYKSTKECRYGCLFYSVYFIVIIILVIWLLQKL